MQRSHFINVSANGEECIATIISYTSYEKEDKDDDGYTTTTTMYTPRYEFKTSDGTQYRQNAEFSSGGTAPNVGETTTIIFDQESEKMISSSATSIIMLGGMFTMWIILFFVSLGLVIYALNFRMNGYFRLLNIVGMTFFIPYVMIAFEALLVYGLFYGNERKFN